jgi:hypothetical protein
MPEFQIIKIRQVQDCPPINQGGREMSCPYCGSRGSACCDKSLHIEGIARLRAELAAEKENHRILQAAYESKKTLLESCEIALAAEQKKRQEAEEKICGASWCGSHPSCRIKQLEAALTERDAQIATMFLPIRKLIGYIDNEGPAAKEWEAISDTTEECAYVLANLPESARKLVAGVEAAIKVRNRWQAYCDSKSENKLLLRPFEDEVSLYDLADAVRAYKESIND